MQGEAKATTSTARDKRPRRGSSPGRQPFGQSV